MHVSVRNPVRRIDPMPGDRSAAPPELFAPSPRVAEWAVLEDDSEARASPPRAETRIDRRVLLVLALAGAIVGFGFAQGSDRARPAAAELDPDANASQAGITLVAPAADARVTGSVVEVVGVAGRPVGTLRLELRAAGVTIGAADVLVASAGSFSARIPVLAPAVELRAELVGKLVAESAEPAFRRTVTLQPAGPVAVWTAEVTRSERGAFVTLTGSAPVAVHWIAVEASSRDGGSRLAATHVPVGLDGALPGSTGGWSLGVGSFRAHLPVPASRAERPIRVTVSWHDGAASSWGSLWITLPGRSGPRRP